MQHALAGEPALYLCGGTDLPLMEQAADSAIFEAFCRGDEKAFEMLFRTWYQRLCRYAVTIVRDMDEAEDLVQQLFTQLWEKRQSLHLQGSLKSYLYRAVYNAALNRERRRKSDLKVREDQQLRIVHAVNEATPKMAGDEFAKALNNALDELPEQCRRVFELSRFEEMKYREIAEHLDISVKTVENQVGKALRILREKLAGFLPLAAIILIVKQFLNLG